MAGALDSVFQAVQSQGKSPTRDDPKSPSDVYLAYLDKADWVAGESGWYLLFDMIPAEAALLGFAGTTGDDLPPPAIPTILFHAAPGASAAAVSQALALGDKDEPAEGSWYALYLQPEGDPATDVVGELYHPDTDFNPKAPTYNKWHIAAASLLALPAAPGGPDGLLQPPPPAPQPFQVRTKLPRTYDRTRQTKHGILKRFRPHKKIIKLRRRRVVVVPPPPPPPGYGALGVMAIGQGGFNLFFDRGTREPAFYYDTGYPLGFFLASVPPVMRVGNPAFQGPILQNAAANLTVILSHWDWDHWRFGAFVNGAGQSLGQLNWTVPAQPMSPTAAGFIAGVAAVVVPVGSPAIPGPNGLIIHKLQPPPGVPHPFLVNNSGLAVRVPVDIAGVQSAGVLLTGDGNFNFLPGPAVAGLHVIGAVHHGSNNHGAAANLPAAPGGTTGRIAYSYGINPANGNHAYGFPAPAAVAAYQAANWNAPTEQSTAEGANLNAGPPAAGNIRVGDQGALPGAYGATAFAAITYALP